MIVTNTSLLEFSGIDMRFPGVHALKNVSFEVKEGEVHALLGANGAGKSTLIKILARVYQQTDGEIFLNGKSLNSASAQNIRQHGIDFIFQELELVSSFTVAENVLLGDEVTKGALLNRREMSKKAQETLDQLIPGFIDARSLARDLTVAQQQLVCIARSLYRNPKILVLDEPTSRLSSSEVDALFSVIDRLKKERNITAIYISHRLEEIYRIADTLTVLRDGEKVVTCKVNEITTKEIIRSMMGKEIDVTKKMENLAPGYGEKPALEVRGLSDGKTFGPIDFDVFKGEVFCITGAVGSGKTELIETIFGLRKAASGTLKINGKSWVPKSPLHAKNKKLSLVPEDRRLNGLVYDFSVRKNISLVSLKKLSRFGFVVNVKKEKEVAKKLVEELSIKTAGLETASKFLSGGNQQKVVFAKWLVGNSEIYFFDEPTVGIDVKGKEEIYEIIHSLAKEGKSVIVTTSDFDEALRASTRIMVLFAGKEKGLLDSETAVKDELLLLTMGGKVNE
jgi:ABC-type sugar transport system ATPase subunit